MLALMLGCLLITAMRLEDGISSSSSMAHIGPWVRYVRKNGGVDAAADAAAATPSHETE